jgi:hypothetical protein
MGVSQPVAGRHAGGRRAGGGDGGEHLADMAPRQQAHSRVAQVVSECHTADRLPPFCEETARVRVQIRWSDADAERGLTRTNSAVAE